MQATWTPITSGGTNSGSTVTSSAFTLPATKRVYVFVYSNGNAISVPTMDGTAMSLVVQWTSGTSTPRIACYSAAGTGVASTVTVATVGSGRLGFGVVSLEDFDALTPIFASVSAGAAGSSAASVGLTSEANDKCLSVVLAWDDISYVSGSGSVLFTHGTSQLGGASLRAVGQLSDGIAGTVTNTGTWGASTQWVGVMISAKARTPVALTLDTPTASALGQVVSVSANATSTLGLASKTASLLPQPSGTMLGPYTLTSAGSGPYALSASLPGVPPGSYKAQVQAINTDGGSDTKLSSTFTIFSLGGSSTVSGTVTGVVSVVPPAIRISEWSEGSATVKVQVLLDGVATAGRSVTATSADTSKVTVTASATTDGSGFASFDLLFKSGGRSLLAFTDSSGAVGLLLAISRTLAA